MKYESGECSQDEIVEGFQDMIDSGIVWSLQGHYGRVANQLLDSGLCHLKG
jgi:hypothetical protein